MIFGPSVRHVKPSCAIAGSHPNAGSRSGQKQADSTAGGSPTKAVPAMPGDALTGDPSPSGVGLLHSWNSRTLPGAAITPFPVTPGLSLTDARSSGESIATGSPLRFFRCVGFLDLPGLDCDDYRKTTAPEISVTRLLSLADCSQHDGIHQFSKLQ